MKMDGTLSTLSRIRENANKLIVSELERYGHQGLAPSHGNILSVLLFQGEMTKTEISEAINKDRSTVTVLLRKLQQHGYIDTRPNHKDSRSSIVFLTKKGKDMKSEFIEISERLFERQYLCMTDEQIEGFKLGLKQIDANFKDI